MKRTLIIAALFGSFLSSTACSLFKRMNWSASAGGQSFLKSDYSTAYQSGRLDPDFGYSLGLGAGYYGLLNNLNLSFEMGRTSHDSTSLGVEMGTSWTMLFGDYYFTPNAPQTYFAGFGFGTVATSFFGDDPQDRGHSYSLRGGHAWRIGNSSSIFFVRASLTQADRAHVRRFYFYGSSADVEHLYLRAEIGLTYNIFETSVTSN